MYLYHGSKGVLWVMFNKIQIICIHVQASIFNMSFEYLSFPFCFPPSIILKMRNSLPEILWTHRQLNFFWQISIEQHVMVTARTNPNWEFRCLSRQQILEPETTEQCINTATRRKWIAFICANRGRGLGRLNPPFSESPQNIIKLYQRKKFCSILILATFFMSPF